MLRHHPPDSPAFPSIPFISPHPQNIAQFKEHENHNFTLESWGSLTPRPLSSNLSSPIKLRTMPSCTCVALKCPLSTTSPVVISSTQTVPQDKSKLSTNSRALAIGYARAHLSDSRKQFIIPRLTTHYSCSVAVRVTRVSLSQQTAQHTFVGDRIAHHARLGELIALLRMI